MSFNERMRVAARFRMQRRFEPQPALRALSTQPAEVDRRRIPLEGLRRTDAWWREQGRIKLEDKNREAARAYFAKHAGESTASPTARHNVYVIVIDQTGYVNTIFTSNLTGNSYGN